MRYPTHLMRPSIMVALGVVASGCRLSSPPARASTGDDTTGSHRAEAMNAPDIPTAGAENFARHVSEAPVMSAAALPVRHAPARGLHDASAVDRLADTAPASLGAAPDTTLAPQDPQLSTVAAPSIQAPVQTSHQSPRPAVPAATTASDTASSIAWIASAVLLWLILLALIVSSIRKRRRRRAKPRSAPAIVSWMPGDVAPTADAWEPAGQDSALTLISTEVNNDFADAPVPAPPAVTTGSLLEAARRRADAISASPDRAVAITPQVHCSVLATTHVPVEALRIDDVAEVAAPEGDATTHVGPAPLAPEADIVEPTAAAFAMRVPAPAFSEPAASVPEPAPAAPATREAGTEAEAAQWARAGHQAWRQAMSSPHDARDSLDQAAEAFSRALALDPSRTDILGTMLARCHLARARLAQGDERVALLDDAVAVHQSLRQMKRPSAGLRADRAEALYERAMIAAPSERGHRLELALDALGGMPDPPDPQDADKTARITAQIQMAHSDATTGSVSESWFEAAIATINSALARSPAGDRDAWLVMYAQCHHQRLLRLKGAARNAFANRTRAQVEPLLLQAQTLAPLVAWLRLLSSWAEDGRGGAATDRFAAVATLLDRAEAISADDPAGLAFARACHLRLRAQSEAPDKRLPLLRDALRLLSPLQGQSLPDIPLELEAAKLHLAAGDIISGENALPDLRLATELASKAGASAPYRVDAMTCELRARLAIVRRIGIAEVEGAALLGRAEQLVALSHEAADPLLLLAEVGLCLGRYETACRACADAWTAGISAQAVLPVWRESLLGWSGAAHHDDASLQEARRHFRSASAFYF